MQGLELPSAFFISSERGIVVPRINNETESAEYFCDGCNGTGRGVRGEICSYCNGTGLLFDYNGQIGNRYEYPRQGKLHSGRTIRKQ